MVVWSGVYVARNSQLLIRFATWSRAILCRKVPCRELTGADLEIPDQFRDCGKPLITGAFLLKSPVESDAGRIVVKNRPV